MSAASRAPPGRRRGTGRAAGRRRRRAAPLASQRFEPFRPAVGELAERFLAQARDGRGELVAPRRRLADPERQRRRHAARVLHEYLVHLDLLHAVRGVAELENVAGHALECEVLADRADAQALGVQHDVVVELVRDHAGVGHGREPRAAPRAQPPVDRVVVQVGRAPAAPGRVALGEHLQYLLEFLRGQIRVRLRAAESRQQLVHAPFAAGDFRDDLLREHIQRLLPARGSCRARRAGRCRGGRCTRPGRRATAETAAPSASRRSAWPARPTRCSNAEINRGEPIWQTRSMSPMSMPSSSEEVATSARSWPAFSRVSARNRCSLERLPWWSRDVLGADALGEVARRALGEAPVVDENQRRPVRLDQLREPVVQLVPDLVRHHRLERRARQLQREVALAHVAGVHDLDVGLAVRRPGSAPCPRAASLSRRVRRARAACRRARPAAPATASGASRACCPRPSAARPRSRCLTLFSIARPDSEVSRMKSDSGVVTRMCGGVLRMRLRSKAEVSPVRTASRIGTSSTPMLEELVADAGERLLEVLLDVVRERLQRRDVEDVHLVREPLRKALDDQVIDCGQECRQRLARPGRRCDQRVTVPGRDRPGAGLRLRGRGKAAAEPPGDGRVEAGEGVGGHRAIVACRSGSWDEPARDCRCGRPTCD